MALPEEVRPDRQSGGRTHPSGVVQRLPQADHLGQRSPVSQGHPGGSQARMWVRLGRPTKGLPPARLHRACGSPSRSMDRERIEARQGLSAILHAEISERPFYGMAMCGGRARVSWARRKHCTILHHCRRTYRHGIGRPFIPFLGADALPTTAAASNLDLVENGRNMERMAAMHATGVTEIGEKGGGG